MAINLGKIFDDIVASVEETTDDIGDLLDFGFGDTDEIEKPTNDTKFGGTLQNPHTDLTEVERANPTNVEFPAMPVLLAIGGAIAGLVALRAFKVI